MWIVLGEDKGRVKLVSKSGITGLLPKGSFLTIEEGDTKFIIRVDDSTQTEAYSPAPMLADMDLSPIKQDQKCQNIVYAFRVCDITTRTDGLIDFIKPQFIARRSTQSEIDYALKTDLEGPRVFLATVHQAKNQLLCDEEGKPIQTRIPNDAFFHQMMICGKTGSGKTVATKYLSQYFVEEYPSYGAVLAINVKDVDFLRMDQPTVTVHKEVKYEWDSLNVDPHGIKNYTIYYPANLEFDVGLGVNYDNCKKITLNVSTIEPEALSGILQGITDIGAQHLPDVFRYWRDVRNRNNDDISFSDFFRHFLRGRAEKYEFPAVNSRGDEYYIKFPWGTFENIVRNIETAMVFFDNKDAETIDAKDILTRGKMSIINVAGKNGIQFGSIILRHLLRNIVDLKSIGKSNVPILIIIDEVHRFYDTSSSREALDLLDTICRTGRSQEIGVIFCSQNPQDIPRGLSSVINTKIFFKSDAIRAREYGINISPEEIQSLKKGYAICNIHDLSQVRVIKYPLSLAGVFEKGVYK
ncbi:MAG: ATP-binding protein [Candidatus Hodarchaeota archaeon]